MKRWLACLVAAWVAVAAQWALAADALTPVGIRQVKVGGEIGRRIDVTIHNNLLKLDADRDFLRPFAEKNRDGGYIGLGKLIDAAARLAAYSGDADALALKKHLVQKALAAQEPDGYFGLMKPARRMWSLWDVHEMSYLVYGLSTDYELFGEKPSLEAARRLADYLIARWTATPDAKPGDGSITVYMAATGLECALLALHRHTGDRRYLDFCRDFRKLPEWDARIVVGRHGPIEGHAYAYLCRCLAQVRLDALAPDPRLLRPTQQAFDFLTRQNGLVITGACGDHECWHDSQQGTINLGETCATAYLMRLCGQLFCREGDTLYGDLIERSLYNTLFAAQSPDGRLIRYYSPFDGPRQYFHGDTYCCPCNYRRIVAELPGMIYYRSGDGVVVDLYTASTATCVLPDGILLGLRQETDYPRSGAVKLSVNPKQPTQFALKLRVPRWSSGAKAAVNGTPLETPPAAGTLLTIARQWQPGDVLTLDLPMPWRLVKGRQAQAGRVAVMRGPQVFCLSRARHKPLAGVDLRLLTLDPQSLAGPTSPEPAPIPGGLACQVRAWGPGKWYPQAKPELALTLTEFPDPDGEATYFNVPDPRAATLVDDELCRPTPAGHHAR